ncbi:MAG: cell division protein FtsA [Dysgonamonadaceae bacterium]|jgi:cell division protein FtsA|nr:cell division protein FtsA [Dysgonamonadaceae bacterium]
MEKVIVALDLGTAKIIAMVAKKGWNEVLSIQYADTVDSGTAIRRGSVYNMKSVSEKISKLIEKLNFKLSADNYSIEKIYLGIGGQALHTEVYSIKKEIENGVVDRNLLHSIDAEIERHPESSLIRKKFRPEYSVDGQVESDPSGAQGAVIEAKFALVMGGRSLANLRETIAKETKVPVADIFVSPLATAEAALTKEEKEKGCALIEFGAALTYVSIYRENTLKHLVTIPIGGAAITKDMVNSNFSEKEAEAYKRDHGTTLIESDYEENTGKQTGEDEMQRLNRVIEARVDEILENVIKQIHYSGYEPVVRSIVITGGGASLRGLAEVIRFKTGKEVRLGLARKALVNQAPEWSQQPANSCVIGLLALGNDNCLKTRESKGGTLFGEDPGVIAKRKKELEEQKEKEKAKKKKEEEEKKKREKGPGIFDKLFNQVERGARILFEEENNPQEAPEETTEEKNEQIQ